MPAADLPFIDEHAIEVAAPPERVWSALRQVLSPSGGRGRERFARLLGASETRSQGDPLEPGSTITGFRIARADAPHELVLEGEHRFSRYALIFHLEALPHDRSRVARRPAPLFRASVAAPTGHS